MVAVEEGEVFCSPMIRSQFCSKFVSLGCHFHFSASLFSIGETGRLEGTGTEYVLSPGGKTHRSVGGPLRMLSLKLAHGLVSNCYSFRCSYQAVRQLLFLIR